MRFYSIIDEKGRYCGSKVDLNQEPGQDNTFTLSYLALRKQFQKDFGYLMGLENSKLFKNTYCKE